MAEWKRQPQERDGDYQFNGKILCTHEVNDSLTPAEILAIILDVKKAVANSVDGLDYFQVYKSDEGNKIYFIDQLGKSMLEGDGYTEEQKEEYNMATILFPHEY